MAFVVVIDSGLARCIQHHFRDDARGLLGGAPVFHDRYQQRKDVFQQKSDKGIALASESRYGIEPRLNGVEA